MTVLRRGLFAALAVLALALGGAVGTAGAVASSSYSTSHTPATQPMALSLQLAGSVQSAPSQQYNLRGGQVVSASVLGYTIDTSRPTHLYYHYTADVNGFGASGNVRLHLRATVAGGAYNGWVIDILGEGSLTGFVPAVCLPSMQSPSPGTSCPSSDTSAVPMYFLSPMSLRVTLTGDSPAHTSRVTQMVQVVPMMFESAYFDPFGYPLFFGTEDMSTISVVASYQQATILWNGVVTAGQASGMLGQTQVSGVFTQNIHEVEDLVSGTARDSGSLTFNGFTDGSGNAVHALDATVSFHGSSTIPPSAWCNSFVCETGFSSEGTFDSHGALASPGSVFMGSYSTSWAVPALAFQSTLTATVSGPSVASSPQILLG